MVPNGYKITNSNSMKTKKATSQLSFFDKPWRQKTPHFPAQKLWKLKMGPKTTWWPRVENLFAFVEFFLLGSNESIPHPGFLFQQKIIAKVIAKLEHLDDQERKRKRNVTWNQKDSWTNKRKKEGKNEKRKRRKKKGQIKQKGNTIKYVDEMQNWIQNQFWFTSDFQTK